ncbi:uroporphyrinogen-III synthase [Dyella psychrodurans]|uniref:Uroporphyrinogen-III synthase n=1 Tax=Dyella psychrodurans TaxID=1927960 RepID=A0A370WX71_9GAMM|nr:uroporphyrinogen-III synthase [Dyella psychrodurans]RDS80712.1 uroporphyrinogen-III synthase [Dyella psychrodurans]
MSAQSSQHGGVLAGCTVVITRPAGTGSTLARRVRALGGVPLLLPGVSLRAAPDRESVRAEWEKAQRDDVLIFTSPTAVRHAVALAPPSTRASVIAVGQSTARALHRHGIDAQVPVARQDSEGVLDLPVLQHAQDRHVTLITAPDGRGLLQQQLAARGAAVREVHVYRRTAPRLGRRHIQAVQHLPATACVLLSSAESIQHLQTQLPEEAWRRLCSANAIASSERIADQARSSGFSRVYLARSAVSDDLLACACDVCSHTCHEADRLGC